MFSKLSSQNPYVRPQLILHYISRWVTQIRFFYRGCSYATVWIRVHKTLSILLHSESCDLVKAHQDARGLIYNFFQGIYGQISMESFMICITWAFPSQMKMAFCRQSHEVHNHYRVNYFLPFIDPIISHLNSRFPQELKAIFYRELSGTSPCQ
jgi:hypothetical protein